MRQYGPEFHIDFQDFVLEIYIIGYRTKGESIVVLFKEQEKVFYSFVIDSYYKKYKRITNRTISILTGNGVKIIPLLIMSHPHEDHIKGIEGLIGTYCDENSQFYYPARSFDIETGEVKLTPKEKKILKLVRENNKNKKTFSNAVGVTAGGYNMLRTVYLYDINDYNKEYPLPIEIVAITPITSVNDAKAVNSKLDPNDLSISIVVNINDYYLLLGSDITNSHIDKLDRELLSGVKFVKIPHHGSSTADKLTKFFLPQQLDYACCTNYNVGSSHLPLESILKEYKIISQRVDVVGCSSKDRRQGLYGELCYRLSLGATGMNTSVSSIGVTAQV